MAKNLNEMSDRAFLTLAKAATLVLASVLRGEAAPDAATIDKGTENYDKDAHKVYNAAARIGKHVVAGHAIGAIAREASNRSVAYAAARDEADKVRNADWNADHIESACIATAAHKSATTMRDVCARVWSLWEDVKKVRSAAKEAAQA